MSNTITLTAAALQHLKENLATSPEGTVGIKIGLRDAGCSGFAYTMDFTSQQEATDQVVDIEGVRILIAEEHLSALNGTEIDLVTEGMNSILEFNNPNVAHECGCGESFQIKEG